MKWSLDHNRFFRPRELATLMATLDWWESQKPDRRRPWGLFYKALAYTGCRTEEAKRLTGKSIYAAETKGGKVLGLVYIKGIKGSNNREVPIPWKIFRLLKDYADTFGPDELLFTMEASSIRKYFRGCLPPKDPRSLHSLRHTYAVTQYEHGRDILQVQHLLGHVNIECTMIYAKFIDSRDKQASTIEAMTAVLESLGMEDCVDN